MPGRVRFQNLVCECRVTFGEAAAWGRLAWEWLGKRWGKLELSSPPQ